MVPRFCTLSLFLADSENLVPSGLMYPRRLPPSERREPAERPDTEDTEEAVDTERSSCGIAPSASDGVAQGSGEDDRTGGEAGVVSMLLGGWGWKCGTDVGVMLRSVCSVFVCCLRL